MHIEDSSSKLIFHIDSIIMHHSLILIQVLLYVKVSFGSFLDMKIQIVLLL